MIELLSIDWKVKKNTSRILLNMLLGKIILFRVLTSPAWQKPYGDASLFQLIWNPKCAVCMWHKKKLDLTCYIFGKVCENPEKVLKFYKIKSLKNRENLESLEIFV